MRSLFLFFTYGMALGVLTTICINHGYNKILVGLLFIGAVCMAAYMEEKEEKEMNRLWKPKK